MLAGDGADQEAGMASMAGPSLAVSYLTALPQLVARPRDRAAGGRALIL